MKSRLRRYAKVLLFLCIGLLILWLITRGQDLELIRREFRQANYGWILLAMLAALMSHFIRAVRWNMLIRALGYQTNPFQTFFAVMTGYLANLALPRMGEITRCITLNKATKTPINVLAGTVVAERVFDFFSLVAIVFITVVTQFGFLRDFLEKIFWSPLLKTGAEHWLQAAVLAMAFIFLVFGAILFIRRKLTAPPEGGFFYKLKHQLRGFGNGIKTIMTIKGKGWFLLYTLLIWGLYYMTVYLCFFAIQATSHLTPVAGLTLLAVGSLGILAPVPGGIGTYHFLTILTLTELYGIQSEPATSYAYITHATQIVVNILAGSVAWIVLSIREKQQAAHP
ncbi:MAG: lysylphosphatidylglycerol synthase transmembrane domain-containing protein [Bacteroidales bacterium]